jgi:uncharacterized protein (TIGR02300 family)
MAVAKPELGIKRQCAHCGAKFYDLGKSPILCPKCGTVYEVTAAPARRQAAKPAPVAEEVVPAAEAETVSLEEVAEQENKSASGKGTPPDLEGEDDEVEVDDSEDDTFLEEEEEESGDVSDLIGEGIDKKEEET